MSITKQIIGVFKRVSVKRQPDLFILTKDELQFFYLIHFANRETIGGLGIDLLIQAPTVIKIRKIIKEFKQQNADNPRVVTEILGPFANGLLSKL